MIRLSKVQILGNEHGTPGPLGISNDQDVPVGNLIASAVSAARWTKGKSSIITGNNCSRFRDHHTATWTQASRT